MKLQNFGLVNLVAISFLFLFTAFNSAENLSAKAMRDDGFERLGFYSVAIVNLVLSFASFLSTAIVNKIGIKLAFILGSLCYFFWILCFLFPANYSQY